MIFMDLFMDHCAAAICSREPRREACRRRQAPWRVRDARAQMDPSFSTVSTLSLADLHWPCYADFSPGQRLHAIDLEEGEEPPSVSTSWLRAALQGHGALGCRFARVGLRGELIASWRWWCGKGECTPR